MPLNWILAVILLWLGIGISGTVVARNLPVVAKGLFPLGAVGALVMAAAGFDATLGPPESLVLPLGLPELPFHLHIDALSGFFLLHRDILEIAREVALEVRPEGSARRALPPAMAGTA